VYPWFLRRNNEHRCHNGRWLIYFHCRVLVNIKTEKNAVSWDVARVDLVWSDVSEKRIASIFKVEKFASEEPTWAGGYSCWILRSSPKRSTVNKWVMCRIVMSVAHSPGTEHRWARSDNLKTSRSQCQVHMRESAMPSRTVNRHDVVHYRAMELHCRYCIAAIFACRLEWPGEEDGDRLGVSLPGTTLRLWGFINDHGEMDWWLAVKPQIKEK
jgi:hypothetical protein